MLQRKDFSIKRSAAGLGLYTNVPIQKNDRIIEYTGPSLTNKEADEKCGMYLFQVTAQRTIDGSVRSNFARYINHSCKPNSEPYVIRGRVIIIARRNIKAGEEITYDYGKEFFNHFIKPFGCRCGPCSITSAPK